MNKKSILIVFSFLMLFDLRIFAFASEDRTENIECIDYHIFDWKSNTKHDFTYSESIETLKDIIYLLETSYVAFDEMEKKGFDKEVFVKNSEKLFINTNSIKIERLYEYICNYLNPYINDSHFNIYIENRRNEFCQSKVIYLSDMFVKKTKTGYSVIKSDETPLGTAINIGEDNLFKTILDGKEVYRVGALAQTGQYGNVINIPLFIGEKKINLKCRYTPEYFLSNDYRVIEARKNVYINIPSCDIESDHYYHFRESGEKYRKKKNVIIDLRKNSGGSDSYYLKFLYDLYSGDEEELSFDDFLEFISEKSKKKISPLVKQQIGIYYDYIKKNEGDIIADQIEKIMTSSGIIYDGEDGNLLNLKSKYKGNLIFLTSKYTASSAEGMIKKSQKLFDNVITVGTNTWGCMKYGDAFMYRLKNSGMVIQICYAQFDFENVLEEGIGFMPDYMISNNLEETITYLTKDKKIAKEISGIN